MHVEQIISPQSITEYFGRTVAGRGRSLMQAGHVGPIKQQAGDAGVYSAAVKGSRGNRYRTWLYVDADSISSECSCPYAFDCKHGAAMAYSLTLGYAPGKAVPAGLAQGNSDTRIADQTDQSVAVWLQQLVGGGAPVRPESGRWHFRLLLDTDSHPIGLRPVKLYLKQNGEWGQVKDVQPYEIADDPYNPHGEVGELRDLLTLLARDEWEFRSVTADSGYPVVGNTGYLALTAALNRELLLEGQTRLPIKTGMVRDLQWCWEKRGVMNHLVPALTPEPDATWRLIKVSPPLYLAGNRIGRVESAIPAERVAMLLDMPPVPDAQFEQVCLSLANHLGDSLPLPEGMCNAQVVSQPTPVVRLIAIDTEADGVLPALRLSAVYGPHEIQLPKLESSMRSSNEWDGGPRMQLVAAADGYLRVERNLEAEEALNRELRRLGLVSRFHEATGEPAWGPGADEVGAYIGAWQKLLPALEALVSDRGWQVEIDPGYTDPRARARVQGEASNHVDNWFDLKLTISIDSLELESSDILARWMDAGMPDSLPLQDEQGAWVMADMASLKPMLGVLLEMFSAGQDTAKLPAYKVVELDYLDDLNCKKAVSLQTLRKKLKNFTGLKPVAPPKSLRADLRDYQAQGLSWMMFLHQYGLGGILADDMGLGKTLQSLAFIQKLKTQRKLARGALVVAPTSLIWNWEQEALRFTPNLSCMTLHGPARHDGFTVMANHDLVITSYALIQRDFELYRQHQFDLVILDEAQNIKNPQAKTTRLVKQLPAAMRLCLTGTPLENHLGELWSIADFSLPGLLGNQRFFARHFRREIEVEGNSERNRELSCRLAPFMLRRTKAAVVDELPQKTEITEMVELARDQKALYESIRVTMEKRVRDLIQKKGAARSHIEFLDALLKLRQACIDARLVKLKAAGKVKSSAKMAWLLEKLPELVEEGRKVLVFSQFTQMIALVETGLNQLGIVTSKLTGQTRKRQDAITAFQEGPASVFLISLKAGGAGLNLTAADTVVHVDPWWNPAVENQATDRAYRIGQDKPVFVYKLVASGTVEEKIQAMQREKQALADAIFDQTGKVGLPNNGEELLALLGS